MAVLIKGSPIQESEYEGTRKSSLSKSTAVPDFMVTDDTYSIQGL